MPEDDERRHRYGWDCTCQGCINERKGLNREIALDNMNRNRDAFAKIFNKDALPKKTWVHESARSYQILLPNTGSFIPW
jgi:hypothetical protein